MNAASNPSHLWTFRRCPYAIRARMALDAAEVDIEHREIVLRDKPAQMLEESPKGTVPVLVLENRVLEESLDIMRWALAQEDPEGWLEGDAVEVQRWLDANDAFKPFLDRYKYANRFPDDTHETARTQCREHLSALDHRLTHGPFLLGERCSLADVALFPFVRQFHFSNVSQLSEWSLESLKQWMGAFLTSSRFERVMEKRPLWRVSTS